MSRLAIVGASRIDPVVGTRRDIQLFHHVAVEIADQQIVRAVGVLPPALVGANHRLAVIVTRLAHQGNRLR